MTVKHPTWELAVNDSALVLMPCPGTKDVSLDDTLAQLKNEGVVAIVSATTHEEFEKKAIPMFGDAVAEHGMKWFHLPIEDDAVPDESFERGWESSSSEILELLKAGKVALHCMGGSGRTGLLAARVLLELDWSLEDIVTEVKALRPGAFSKPEQKEYISKIAQQ